MVGGLIKIISILLGIVIWRIAVRYTFFWDYYKTKKDNQ